MKKFGIILIAVLIGTILFEIIIPAIGLEMEETLKFIIEIVVIAIFAFIGLAIFNSTDEKRIDAASD